MTQTINRVVAAFVKLRDQKEEIEKRHKEELRVLNESMQKLGGWLQASLLTAGVESFKTSQGTAFLQHNDKTVVRDFTAALDFIREHNEWSMLTAAVSKTAVKDYMERTGSMVPGVEYQSELKVIVRRPK